MLRLHHIIGLLLLFLFSLPAEAQFLKKLNKKVQDAAENKVLDKSANKTSQSVDKGMDDIFSIGKDKPKKTKKQSKNDIFSSKKSSSNKAAASPRSSYFFSHLYVLDFKAGETTGKSGKVEADIDLFLTKGGEYLGMRGGENEHSMVIVMDYPRSTAFSFISSDNQKMVYPMNIDLSDAEEEEEIEDMDFKISNLPNKNFLGYNCKGKQLENEEWKLKLYYTDEVPVSMSSMFRGANSQDDMTSIFKRDGMNISDGLIMFMEGNNKQDPSQNYVLQAKKLEKIDFDFDTSDYQIISGF